MELEFEYDEKIARFLKECSPYTHMHINIYHGSVGLYQLFDQNKHFQDLQDRIQHFPNISDEVLKKRDATYAQFVIPLLGTASSSLPVVKRTIDAHYRRSARAEPFIRDSLSVLIARCMPLFLLESASNNPRRWLGRIKRGQIIEYVRVPSQAAYTIPLTTPLFQ